MRKFQWVVVICVETIIYLLLYNLRDCAFKEPVKNVLWYIFAKRVSDF